MLLLVGFFFLFFFFGVVVLLWFCRFEGCVALSGWGLFEVPFGLLLLVSLLRALSVLLLVWAVWFCFVAGSPAFSIKFLDYQKKKKKKNTHNVNRLGGGSVKFVL